MVIFDLSHYHPVKDWSKIKKISPFIITKATQGTTFVDSYMDTVIKKCEELKIPYWLFAFMNDKYLGSLAYDKEKHINKIHLNIMPIDEFYKRIQ